MTLLVSYFSGNNLEKSVEFCRDIYMKVMVQDIGTSVLIFLLRLKEMKTRSLEIYFEIKWQKERLLVLFALEIYLK